MLVKCYLYRGCVFDVTWLFSQYLCDKKPVMRKAKSKNYFFVMVNTQVIWQEMLQRGDQAAQSKKI